VFPQKENFDDESLGGINFANTKMDTLKPSKKNTGNVYDVKRESFGT